MRTTPGLCFGTTHTPSTYRDNLAILQGWPADVAVEGVIYREVGYSPSDNHELELLGRFVFGASNARGIEVLINAAGGSDIVCWNGAESDFTTGIGTSGPGFGSAPVTGDVVRVEFVGNSIVAKRNGTMFLSGTDSTWANGNPGCGAFSRGGDVNLSKLGWSSITVTAL